MTHRRAEAEDNLGVSPVPPHPASRFVDRASSVPKLMKSTGQMPGMPCSPTVGSRASILRLSAGPWLSGPWALDARRCSRCSTWMPRHMYVVISYARREWDVGRDSIHRSNCSTGEYTIQKSFSHLLTDDLHRPKLGPSASAHSTVLSLTRPDITRRRGSRGRGRFSEALNKLASGTLPARGRRS